MQGYNIESDCQLLQKPRKDILQFLYFRLLHTEQLITAEIKTNNLII